MEGGGRAQCPPLHLGPGGPPKCAVASRGHAGDACPERLGPTAKARFPPGPWAETGGGAPGSSGCRAWALGSLGWKPGNPNLGLGLGPMARAGPFWQC